jgi:hypothetical protein
MSSTSQGPPPESHAEDGHPVRFSVDYPDRELNRLTTAFRIIIVIPIAIVLGAISGYQSGGEFDSSSNTTVIAIGGTGLLFLPPLLMLVFRQKYPRWWFDWNLELLRFVNRVCVYVALMDDRYPSTDEQQSVHLDFDYPDAKQGLALIAAWFAILFTGRYPRGLFDYLEGVIRWHNRVNGYAYILVTDQYPPFRLRP